MSYQKKDREREQRKKLPDGSAKRYIVIGNRPRLQFVHEQACPEWLNLKEEEKNGTLWQRFPHVSKPNAGTGMTEQMLKQMTFGFDADGEFVTEEKDLAVSALRAMRASDQYARLHWSSLPIEDELLIAFNPSDPTPKESR